ncbi:hypothetical protein C8R43DRAFT_1236366 [Mycena crocata]|nr:hypothetical protein C8R43DRAFT_1236366 [Mycena crocata]
MTCSTVFCGYDSNPLDPHQTAALQHLGSILRCNLSIENPFRGVLCSVLSDPGPTVSEDLTIASSSGSGRSGGVDMTGLPKLFQLFTVAIYPYPISTSEHPRHIHTNPPLSDTAQRQWVILFPLPAASLSANTKPWRKRGKASFVDQATLNLLENLAIEKWPAWKAIPMDEKLEMKWKAERHFRDRRRLALKEPPQKKIDIKTLDRDPKAISWRRKDEASSLASPTVTQPSDQDNFRRTTSVIERPSEERRTLSFASLFKNST